MNWRAAAGSAAGVDAEAVARVGGDRDAFAFVFADESGVDGRVGAEERPPGLEAGDAADEVAVAGAGHAVPDVRLRLVLEQRDLAAIGRVREYLRARGQRQVGESGAMPCAAHSSGV